MAPLSLSSCFSWPDPLLEPKNLAPFLAPPIDIIGAWSSLRRINGKEGAAMTFV